MTLDAGLYDTSHHTTTKDWLHVIMPKHRFQGFESLTILCLVTLSIIVHSEIPRGSSLDVHHCKYSFVSEPITRSQRLQSAVFPNWH
jgi:hypothetical protein